MILDVLMDRSAAALVKELWFQHLNVCIEQICPEVHEAVEGLCPSYLSLC